MKKIFLVILSILLIVFLVVVHKQRKKMEEAKYTEIGLYFYDENAQYFVRTTKRVFRGNNLPQVALQELIKGPSQKNLAPVISKNVKIKNFYVQFETALVDFDKNLLDYGGGTTAEMGIIGGVVLTLTDFEEIKCVQFLIEGKRIEYLPEGIEILKPICRKDVEKLVK